MSRRNTYRVTYVLTRCLLTLRDSPIVVLLLGLLALFAAHPAAAQHRSSELPELRFPELPEVHRRETLLVTDPDPCAEWRKYAEKPPFELTPEGFEAWVKANPSLGASKRIEILGWDGKKPQLLVTGPYDVDAKAFQCQSNQVSAWVYGRLTDPRGSRICKVSLRWTGAHRTSLSTGEIVSVPSKGLTHYMSLGCRWL